MKQVFLILLFMLTSCSRPMPVLGEIPDFKLVNQSNDSVTREDFRSSAWVANFIFTNCQDICPLLTKKMSSLQDIDGLKLVSISVDPQTDTPEVLSQYAASFRADLSKWSFLTGPPDAIEKLVVDGFKVTVGKQHMDKFVLVDKEGKIRGYYSPDEIEKIRWMDWGYKLATLNATLNGLSAVFLIFGLIAIKRKNIPLHQKCMLTAFGISILFLVSYVLRFSLTGVHRFEGTGHLRTIYFLILFTHTPLAAITPVLALRTLYLAWKKRFDSHKRIARITWPIWMYVSITGVVVYWMLYH